jgi:protein-histidine pros-kinase
MKLPGPITPDQERQLSIVQSSARHLLSLINELLDLAKVESGKASLVPELLDCAALLREVEEALRPLADQKGLALSLVLPPEDVKMRADRRAVKQIVINLVNNAIKFTDRGSVHVAVRSNGDALAEISVSDTGSGIGPEDQVRLFRPFTQLDGSATRRHEGTGLGLHLSQKLAELMGGHISMQSEVGSGSVFTLTLPA